MSVNNNNCGDQPSGLHYAANTSGCPIARVSELVRARAYQLFELRGGRPGHALDDWLQAEQEFRYHLNLSE
jgi:hypothetical protein